MVKVVFTKEDKLDRTKTVTEEYECKECMVFDSIAVMKGVTGCSAKSVRIPLFKVTRMDTYE